MTKYQRKLVKKIVLSDYYVEIKESMPRVTELTKIFYVISEKFCYDYINFLNPSLLRNFKTDILGIFFTLYRSDSLDFAKMRGEDINDDKKLLNICISKIEKAGFWRRQFWKVMQESLELHKKR